MEERQKIDGGRPVDWQKTEFSDVKDSVNVDPPPFRRSSARDVRPKALTLAFTLRNLDHVV